MNDRIDSDICGAPLAQFVQRMPTNYAIDLQHAIVLQNIRHRFDGDGAREDAIALFRLGACLLGSVDLPDSVRTIRREDLRCEAGHALYEYHDLEDGVGYRILCPACDIDYLRELAAAVPREERR